MSLKKELMHGVPQGSVLGPLLFLLYINDIVKELKYCSCGMFADNTIIYVSDRDPAEIERELNTDLKNIVRWPGKKLVKIKHR